jgi:hypothetical protein
LLLRALCIHPSHALVVELTASSAWSSDFEYKRLRRLFNSYMGCKRASIKAVRGKRQEKYAISTQAHPRCKLAMAFYNFTDQKIHLHA